MDNGGAFDSEPGRDDQQGLSQGDRFSSLQQMLILTGNEFVLPKGRPARFVAQITQSLVDHRNDFTDSDESADPSSVNEPILKAVSGVSENI